MQLNQSWESEELGIDALSDLFHRYLTGLILAMVVELGEGRAADVMKGLFRRQQEERFLPGLKKLGLSDEPDAVACAKYHFLSNHVGGVSVAYIAESDTKAWIRYLPRAGFSTEQRSPLSRHKWLGQCCGAGTRTVGCC